MTQPYIEVVSEPGAASVLSPCGLEAEDGNNVLLPHDITSILCDGHGHWQRMKCYDIDDASVFISFMLTGQQTHLLNARVSKIQAVATC